MFHAPSSPFADPSDEEQQSAVQIEQARIEAQQVAGALLALLANAEFNWFMQAALVAAGAREQRDALNRQLSGKERRAAVERLDIINELLAWPERTLAEKQAYLKATAPPET